MTKLSDNINPNKYKDNFIRLQIPSLEINDEIIKINTNRGLHNICNKENFIPKRNPVNCLFLKLFIFIPFKISIKVISNNNNIECIINDINKHKYKNPFMKSLSYDFKKIKIV